MALSTATVLDGHPCCLPLVTKDSSESNELQPTSGTMAAWERMKKLKMRNPQLLKRFVTWTRPQVSGVFEPVSLLQFVNGRAILGSTAAVI